MGPERPRRFGYARIVVGVVLAAIVVAVIVIGPVGSWRDERARADHAGTWVLVGSQGREYIELRADGSYSVKVGLLKGSVPEDWSVDDGRIFIPAETTLGGGSGDAVRGCYLEIRGDGLVCATGSLKGTYRRQ
jgi:hypothetical protein